MRQDLPTREGAANVLVARLEALGQTIDQGEREELGRALSGLADVGVDRDIVREREVRTEATLLVSGWACRYGDLPDGRRQILALHVAGDFVDLHSYQLKVMDHSVRTLTPCRVAFAPHENITRITERFPRLARQLWLCTLVDAAIVRTWLLGVGQRSALENAAHLFCELYFRLRAVGLAEANAFTLPMNQTELSEALGISPVHANRVMQELRARNLVRLRGHAVEIPDLRRLELAAGFDPTYLHLAAERASPLEPPFAAAAR